MLYTGQQSIRTAVFYVILSSFPRLYVILSSFPKVWYDKSLRLVRYDFRPHNNAAPYYNTDAATEVHDFNTGKCGTSGGSLVVRTLKGGTGSNLNLVAASNSRRLTE